MEALTFSVAVLPRGKGRPRATVRRGSQHATVYTDPKTRAYEAGLKAAAGKVMRGRAPFEGALAVSLRFRIPVPPSFSKKRIDAILTGVEPYGGAFDTDNLAKAVLDGFNGVVFADDRQIAELNLVRIPSQRPGIDIKVERFRLQVTA